MNKMQPLIIKSFDLCPYETTWQAMQQFTDQRTTKNHDELWLLQHTPIYTQGQNGSDEHLLNTGEIPLIRTDRGGQITYHGPGQLMVYTLFDLRRLSLTVRDLVQRLEQAAVGLLADYQIAAHGRREAPGVYLADGAKICSIGLRVRRGCSYHGMAINTAMDLKPFKGINPCGLPSLKLSEIRNFIPQITIGEVADKISQHIARIFNYTVLNSTQPCRLDTA